MHRTCYLTFFSLVLDLLSFTLILPLLPAILEHYRQHDESGLYQYLESKADYLESWAEAPAEQKKVLLSGLIGSWFSFLQFLSSPLIGAVSDVYGRRGCLIVTLMGGFLSYLIWSLSSSSFLWFLVSRTLAGLSKGNVSLSTAIVTDVSPESKRGKAMALIGVAFSIGFIVGPIIGATISHVFKNSPGGDVIRFPALFAASLAIANVAFVSMYFSESLPEKRRAGSIGKGLWQAYGYISPGSLFSFSPVVHIEQKDLHTLKEAGWIYFLYLFLYSGLEYTLTFLTNLRFHYTSMQQGKMYLFCGLIMTAIQGGLIRRIRPGDEIYFALLGVSLVIPSFVIVGLCGSVTLLFFGLTLYSVASALVVPCLTSIVSSRGPPDQKGTVLGIFRSIGALARALGPITASMLFWQFGSVACYCGGGLLLCAPLLYLWSLKRTLVDEAKEKTVCK